MTDDPLEPPSRVVAVCSLAHESRERLQIDLWTEPERLRRPRCEIQVAYVPPFPFPGELAQTTAAVPSGQLPIPSMKGVNRLIG